MGAQRFGAMVALIRAGCGDPGLPHSQGRRPAPFDPGSRHQPRVTPAELSPSVTELLFSFTEHAVP